MTNLEHLESAARDNPIARALLNCLPAVKGLISEGYRASFVRLHVLYCAEVDSDGPLFVQVPKACNKADRQAFEDLTRVCSVLTLADTLSPRPRWCLNEQSLDTQSGLDAALLLFDLYLTCSALLGKVDDCVVTLVHGFAFVVRCRAGSLTVVLHVAVDRSKARPTFRRTLLVDGEPVSESYWTQRLRQS